MLPPPTLQDILVKTVLNGGISHRISTSIASGSGGSKPPPYDLIDAAEFTKQSFGGIFIAMGLLRNATAPNLDYQEIAS